LRIAIVTATTTDRITGVAEYLINLIRHLQAIDTRNRYYIVTTRDNRYMFDLVNPNFTEVALPLRQRPWLVMRSLYHTWQGIGLPLWCRFKGIDLVHLPNTLFASPLLDAVVTIHDVAELKTRKYSALRTFLRKRMIKSAIRNARRIIADSASTASDLEAIGARNATTIHLGFDDAFATRVPDEPREREVLERFGVERRKYIVCIGTLMKHKNLPNVVAAFDRIAQRQPGYRLLLVGARDNAYQDVLDAIAGSSVADRIALLDYVSVEDKRILLANAALSCLVSSYEGFGLPVLEAQAAGVPVLTSDVSSLPEVAGEGAVQVDPNDVAAMAEKMLACLCDDALRERLIALGHENVKRFSWRRCAVETLQVYEDARADGR
jgi:glycosyltransferase involved in cell wall biosynthesis